MSDKQLFRVAVEGEVWVMANDADDARRVAQRAVTMNRDEIDFYVYPMLPVSTTFVEDDLLNSIPHGCEMGDERTVRDHLQQLAQQRAVAK